MKKIGLALSVIILIGLASLFVSRSNRREENKNFMTLKISSSAFRNGEAIPKKYTCDGENVSPALSIREVPKGAKSLVLIVDDPDAPSGTFTHWILFNIDPKTSEIREGNVPAGATQGINDFGKLEYGGPCPPTGTHNYFFKVFALDTVLTFSESPKKSELEAAMSGHILASGELVGKYSRK